MRASVKRLVLVTLVPMRFSIKPFVVVEFVMMALVSVAFVARRSVVETLSVLKEDKARVSPVALVKMRLVTVALVIPALVAVKD